MLSINCTTGRAVALAIGLGILATMSSGATRPGAGDFRNAVEGVMPLFQTNATLFRAAVNAEKLRLKSMADQGKDQSATTALDCEELSLLREMTTDVKAWGTQQFRVFSEMAIESLAAAGEGPMADMAMLCFADIKGAIKSKVIPGYEFVADINPQTADKSVVAAFNSRRAADSRQRAIRRVDEDMCVALIVNAAEYVRTVKDIECRKRFVKQLSEKNVLSDIEMNAVAAGDWKAVFPLRH